LLVDSHCHLADEVFAADLSEVVQRARSAGVTSALCIVEAGSAEERRRAGTLAALWPDVRYALGVHPHRAGTIDQVSGAVDEVERGLAERHDIRAIGEIGLDYYYDFAPREAQRAVFAAQIGLAAARGLPVVIHAREAEAEVIELLQAEGRGRLRGVFHCYTGDVPTVHRVLDLGFCIGFGGIVTFPRGQNIRDVLARVPLDRVLVETDSPYLAPVPHRGRRNEPAWVVRVAEAVAGVLGLAPMAVAESTTRNYEAVFAP
jgi:TatD DNase family protein